MKMNAVQIFSLLSTPKYAKLLLQLALRAETHILGKQCVTGALLNCFGSPWLTPAQLIYQFVQTQR